MEIVTPRLVLRPLTAEAIDALIARDSANLEAATGATWPSPLEAPPNVEDALPVFRVQVLAAADDEHQPHWYFLDRWSQEAVGMAGVSPAEGGTFVLGYCVYPAFEGQGLATEAVRALVEWSFRRPEVTRIEATITPQNVASQHVAAKIGMRQAGEATDPEEGTVLVFTLERPPVR